MSVIDEYIKHGPELDTPIPNISFGKMLYDRLLTNPLKVELMIDAFTGEKITAKELLKQSCNLAEALRVTGYGSNARLAIASENTIQFCVPVLASLFNRTIATLVNPAYTPREIKHCLDITQPKIVFCSYKYSKKLIDMQNDFKYVEKIIIINSNKTVKGAKTIKDFVSESLKGRTVEPENFQPLELDPASPALVLYSSGTTGLPKGVTLSHRNFVVYHSIVGSQPFDPDNPLTGIGITPFFHSMGFSGVLYTLLNNRRYVVMSRFDEDVFLKTVQDYRLSILYVPPPLMLMLAKSPKVKNYDLSSLQAVGSGAAPIHSLVQEEVAKRLNLVGGTSQGYGLTEATCGVIFPPPLLNKPGSCGNVAPTMSCKIRDPETGKTLGPFETGELCCKGPMVMIGYFNDEKATKEAFTEDGWLRTGDLAYYDEEDCFYIVDRLKELIKYKGYQVAPAELEGLLLSHPCIKDAAVVGRPDEMAGELPTAFVVKREGKHITEKEIQNFIAGLISRHKRLTGGVIFISEIPKTPTGKILRKELRKTLENKQPNYVSKL